MKFLFAIILFICFIKNINSAPLYKLTSHHQNYPSKLSNILKKKDASSKNYDRFIHWKQDSYFRGVNIHPFKKFSPFSMREPISKNDLIELKKLGVNLVVANYPGVFQYFPPYEIDSFYLRSLDRIVELTGKLKLNLVISLRSGPGRSLYTFFDKIREDEHLYHNTETMKKYIEMCVFITKRYKNFNHIAGINFLLEPHGDDPVSTTPINDSVYFNLIEDLIKNVREADSLIPIIVQPSGWAYPDRFTSMRKFNDERIIYSFDMYFPHTFTNEKNDSAYPGYYFVKDSMIYVDSNYLKTFLSPVIEFKEKYRVPIFVNEYGGIRHKKGFLNYLKDLHQIFLDNGFHFAAYVWKSEWIELDGRSFDDFNYEKGLDLEEPDKNLNELIIEFKRVWKKRR